MRIMTPPAAAWFPVLSLCAVLNGQTPSSRMPPRVAEEAEVLAQNAARILTREALEQRSVMPPSRFRPRAGSAADQATGPRLRVREVVSEFSFGALRSSAIPRPRRVSPGSFGRRPPLQIGRQRPSRPFPRHSAGRRPHPQAHVGRVRPQRPGRRRHRLRADSSGLHQPRPETNGIRAARAGGTSAPMPLSPSRGSRNRPRAACSSSTARNRCTAPLKASCGYEPRTDCRCA